MNRIKMVSGFIVLSFLMAGCGLNAGGAGIKAAGITGQMSQAAKGILAAQTLENLSQVTGSFLERESDEARKEAAAAVQAAEEARREAEEAERQAAIEAARAADPYWDRPEIDPESWEFILANPWNDIGDYTPELASLEGQRFDVRIVDAMRDFAEAARDEGLSVYLSSGYRSYDEQTYLFRRKAAEYGETVAATIVARPGTSEHQTGLCCDITDRYYEKKDRSLENTALYQWMSENCGDYGFIVRFPDGKEDITGIIYEPWHFRYVGAEAATYIMEHDLTLEEFLELYRDEMEEN